MFIKLPSGRACHLVVRHAHLDIGCGWRAETVATLQFAWPQDKSYGPVHAGRARCVTADRFVKRTGLRLAVARVLAKSDLAKPDRKAVWEAALPKLAARPSVAADTFRLAQQAIDAGLKPKRPFASWPAEDLSHLRTDARDLLAGLVEHGDPFQGGDWSLAQILRHYVELTGGWGPGGSLAAAKGAGEISAGKGEMC